MTGSLYKFIFKTWGLGSKLGKFHSISLLIYHLSGFAQETEKRLLLSECGRGVSFATNFRLLLKRITTDGCYPY